VHAAIPDRLGGAIRARDDRAQGLRTPVLAFRRGSVAEVVEDGVTGYAVDSVEEALSKIDLVLSLDRAQVRRRFEQRFTAERMVQDYLKVYAKLIARDEEPHVYSRADGDDLDMTL